MTFRRTSEKEQVSEELGWDNRARQLRPSWRDEKCNITERGREADQSESKESRLTPSKVLIQGMARKDFTIGPASSTCYVVDWHGLGTCLENVVTTYNSFPKPTMVTELKRLLGVCSWYRRFVSGFSDLMAPNDFMKGKKKKPPLYWSDQAGEAFETIKKKLISVLFWLHQTLRNLSLSRSTRRIGI
ncbi:hypothetical protein ILUMI_21371 [Ignelater luminosus]|uniref:Uncharacterized protein n=1 Tax=Ignelater luminosus TaxID=2038154 RepID=A0A8K0CJ07_IGNLU|nr:hypothetical protein ILUMI_21371 [Ignelater luminosus]